MEDNFDEIMAAEMVADNEEFDSSEEELTATVDSMPQLPNGLGLDYEEVRALLAMKHETAVSLDDPILMMVTIINSALNQQEKLNEKHNQALIKIMSDKTKDYVDEVKKTSGALAEILAEASVAAIHKIFNEHAAALQAAKINNRWCAAIVAISALANIIILALR